MNIKVLNVLGTEPSGDPANEGRFFAALRLGHPAHRHRVASLGFLCLDLAVRGSTSRVLNSVIQAACRPSFGVAKDSARFWGSHVQSIRQVLS